MTSSFYKKCWIPWDLDFHLKLAFKIDPCTLCRLNIFGFLKISVYQSDQNKLTLFQEVKPTQNQLKQKILENYVLMSTKNSTLVSKAISNFMELSQVEVRKRNLFLSIKVLDTFRKTIFSTGHFQEYLKGICKIYSR